MTCSSSAFLLPSCGKRSWDRGKQKGEKGESKQLNPHIFIQTCVEDTETRTCITLQPLPLGPPSTCMVSSAALELRLRPLSRAPSCCLSCSPIVGYFLFGAVGMYGEGRVFFPASCPNCLHIGNSTSSSPIKQARWAWLYVVMSSSHFFARRP